jgi:nuclear pore complex protein Nup155
VSSLSLSRVVEDASRLAATNFKPLVHMAVVPTQEDSLVHLVVNTGFGARLYFSTCASDDTSQSARPSTLNLLHVHLPPGFAPSAASQ